MRAVHVALAALVVAPFAVGTAVGVAGDRDHDGDEVFAFEDGEILESSGLVARDDLFITVNDSGDGARVFAVDPDSGQTVGHTTWDADPYDIEALAPAADGTDVWVGDIGDNLGGRASITITRVPTGGGELSGALASYELVYPGGARDAESLLVHPRTGRMFVVTKELIAGIYAVPEDLSTDGANRMKRLGDVIYATDAAFLPDGMHFVVRDYGSAAFYTFPGLELVDEIELPDQDQGEAIAVDADGDVFVSSEGENAEVLEIDLPKDLRAELAGRSAEEPDGAGNGDGESGSADDDADVDVGIALSPWVIGGAAFLIGVVVLLRALRPR